MWLPQTAEAMGFRKFPLQSSDSFSYVVQTAKTRNLTTKTDENEIQTMTQ